MKKLFKIAICLLAFVVMFSSVACGDDQTSSPAETNASPESIVINNTQTTVKAGSFEIVAEVLPSNADQRYSVTLVGAPAGVTVNGSTVTVAGTCEDGLEFKVKVTSIMDMTVSASKTFKVDNPASSAIEIRTAEEFSNIRNDLSGNYILKNDIDLKNVDWQPIGSADIEDNAGHIVTVGVGFSGRLNGNGYTVKNFKYDNPDAELVGLFGQIEKTGVVEKMGLQGSLRASKWSGAMVGINHGTIRNCFIDVEVEGTAYPMSAVAGNNKGKVEYTVAVNTVKCADGPNGAGFVGSTDGQVTKSYANKDKIPYAYGWGKTPDRSVSKSESELKTASTYSSWDSTVWYIADGIFPMLRHDGFVPPKAEILVNITNTQKAVNLKATPAQNSLQITYEVSNATDNGVTFALKQPVAGVSLSNSGLISIDSSVKDNSYATVVVTSKEDPSKNAEYTLKINNFDPASSIEIGSYDDILKYLVNTTDDADLAKNYHLTKDIDVSQIMWNAMIGSNADGDGAFNGTFNGNGHTIVGFTGGNATAQFGMFKKIGSNGIIKNLAIEIGERRIYGGNDSAIITNENNGLIENVMVSGEIMGTNTNAAGFVFVNNGTIRNCVSLVKVLLEEALTPTSVQNIAHTNNGTISKVFIDKDVTRATRVLSIADEDLDANCISTELMKTASTFSMFDSNVWNITDGEYPSLRK